MRTLFVVVLLVSVLALPVFAYDWVTNLSNGHRYTSFQCPWWTGWAQSEEIAVGLGGHLATINDSVENWWIYAVYGQQCDFLWIGLNEADYVFRTWAWSSGEPLSYVNWAPGEPSGPGAEHWVAMEGGLHGYSFLHIGQWCDLSNSSWDPPYVHMAVVEVVPEPSSLLALGSLVAPLILLRRRKEMKILVLVAFLLAIAVSAFALPTYTSNTHIYNSGTYGWTSIPTWISDETGCQLFDGDYGGYDWFENPGGVHSVEDYWARYEQENGYGYGWVAWYADVLNPTIVFDMGSLFTFQQIGIHGYQRLSGSMPIPASMNISFSNDGVDFSSRLGLDVSGFVPEDSVIWKSASFESTTSRFIRIEFPNTGGAAYWIDELSINGMDGTQFAASVPEPSSFIALGALLTPLLFRRRSN